MARALTRSVRVGARLWASNLAASTATEAHIHVRSPCFRSNPLSDRLGCNVWLKMDCMQPSGSFKLRGLSAAVANAASRGATSIVSSSGGNAGLATAHAAREVGLPCTIFVPESTPPAIIKKLQAYGATAIVHGSVWDEANERAIEEANATGGELVHPFDQQDVWDGNASLVHELATDLAVKPDAIVTVCGGGGLLLGILQGLEDVGWEGTPVLVAETAGADSLNQSLAAGELVTLPAITSVAKSLGARRISETAFNKCRDLGPSKVSSWVTTDAAAVRACGTFLDDHRVMVEPACGAGLAAVYEKVGILADRHPDDTILVEVCGGALMDSATLATMRAHFDVVDNY